MPDNIILLPLLPIWYRVFAPVRRVRVFRRRNNNIILFELADVRRPAVAVQCESRARTVLRCRWMSAHGRRVLPPPPPHWQTQGYRGNIILLYNIIYHRAIILIFKNNVELYYCFHFFYTLIMFTYIITNSTEKLHFFEISIFCTYHR